MVEVYNSFIHLIWRITLSASAFQSRDQTLSHVRFGSHHSLFFCLHEGQTTGVFSIFHIPTKCSPPPPHEIRPTTLDVSPPRHGPSPLQVIARGASPSSLISIESKALSPLSVGLQASETRDDRKSRCRRGIRKVALLVEAFLRLRRSTSRASVALALLF